jgi:hypothetical protein
MEMTFRKLELVKTCQVKEKKKIYETDASLLI